MKKITIILAALFLASIMAVGGWWFYSSQEAAFDNDQAGSLEELLEKLPPYDRSKMLIIGYAENYPPLEFKNAQGELVGFDIDLINKATPLISDKEVIIRPIQWSQKLELLNSKEIDLIWSGFNITEERKKDYLFSKPYLTSEIAVVVKMSSKIFVEDDLGNMRVGIEKGAPKEELVNFSTIKGESLVIDDSFEDAPSALAALYAGDVDAVVIDRIVADYYVKGTPSTFRILKNLQFGKTVFGVASSKDNAPLIERVNLAIEQLQENNEYQAISDKWFK